MSDGTLFALQIIYMVVLTILAIVWFIGLCVTLSEWHNASSYAKKEDARIAVGWIFGGAVATLLWPLTIVTALGYGVYRGCRGAGKLFSDAFSQEKVA